MGHHLMTREQQEEYAALSEAHTHQGTMRFTALDWEHLQEYHALADRLAHEARKEKMLAAAKPVK